MDNLNFVWFLVGGEKDPCYEKKTYCLIELDIDEGIVNLSDYNTSITSFAYKKEINILTQNKLFQCSSEEKQYYV
jgi:hypothetical protein